MLQCNHKERSSYPLRCNMRSPCVIPSSRKIHRFFLRNFYPAACLCFCQVLKRLPYAVRSFLHFFSKQSFRMLLVHRVLLVFVVLPAAISVFLASVLCVRHLFRFPCHIINHIRLYIKAIGNLAGAAGLMRQRTQLVQIAIVQGPQAGEPAGLAIAFAQSGVLCNGRLFL